MELLKITMKRYIIVYEVNIRNFIVQSQMLKASSHKKDVI
jgi:hypothetical protein